MREAPKHVLKQAIVDLRQRTLRTVEKISGDQWLGPNLPIVNPPLWELGHIAWFQELWCLRDQPDGSRLPSLRSDADALFDSSDVIHQRRWDLSLPSPEQTHQYLAQVLERCLEKLDQVGDDDQALYFSRFAMFHEMMHVEAFCYSAQTLSHVKPACLPNPPTLTGGSTQVELPAGTVSVGSEPGPGFIFDNEKWATAEPVAAFSIDQEPVSNAAFAAFVQDGGYQNERWWDATALAAMRSSNRQLPTYWREERGQLWCRQFDALAPLPIDQAVMNINAFEAEAWCRWAGRRLPSEAEWQYAAQAGVLGFAGSSVWEWTASVFDPLPGFSADHYRDYSEPWFGTHRVVRGGSFATPTGMLDHRFRNFYTANRADAFLGFRSCAK